MKTSNVVASLLFGSLAAAVPVKRDLYTKTELVVETVVVFTTVWDDGSAPTVATTTAGAFYEQPSKAASSVVEATSTSAYVAPVVKSSSSVYVAPTSTAAPQPESTTSAYTPPAVSTSQAAVAPSSVYTPSPVSSAPAASSSAASGSTTSTGSGQTYSNVDLTVYDTGGVAGMCQKNGEILDPNAMTVALSVGLMGTRITDPQTGDALNEMCGKKIEITYNGKSIEATINDGCAGCKGPNDVDLTRGAMKALVGTDAAERYSGASWKVIG